MSRSVVLVASVLALAIALGAVTLSRASEEVYAIPRWGVVTTLVLLAAAVAGCLLIASARQAALSAAVLAGTALAVLGVLAMWSFGLLALLGAVVVLAWAGTRRWSGARRGRAAAGAVLAGAPLPVLLVFALSGPLVDCHRDGVTSGENVFLGLSSGSGTSSGSASGDGRTFSGQEHGSDYAYSYTCRDGELVSFALRER